ncbi:hypothetical protein [Hydrogenophaga electricum]|uniref:DUF4175 domain-containing protein n=1 Tax=Hydrogenophaga electricum TaxID=1230953 RepID=A0ABQ6C8V6_9BURK|nr:hypothetical protein [Hydrogenophaga electricum]GLS16723.1 hypothetical protein GCM10007935_41670 [Hydrogenophaga electricum]
MSLWQIFRWPLVVGLLCLIGLITGLVSDDWGDHLAAIGLGLPVLLSAWFGWRRPRA